MWLILAYFLIVNRFLGVLLGGFFGYTDHPTLSDAVWHVLYLLPVLWWFLRGSRPVSPKPQLVSR